MRCGWDGKVGKGREMVMERVYEFFFLSGVGI